MIRRDTSPMAIPSRSFDLVLSSPRKTESFGSTIGQLLQGGDVLALIGDLGAGKTALVRGIVSGLGLSPVCVTSPTFMLVHEYHGQLPLIHIDLYRLTMSEEIESIGLSDYFRDDVAMAIEWADRFPDLLPQDRLEIRLAHRTPNTRQARITAQGSRACSLLARLKKDWRSPHTSAHPHNTDHRTDRKMSHR
jgi:tRNA threonylcarbamoyladenosine biosynthesis protein TsaE